MQFFKLALRIGGLFDRMVDAMSHSPPPPRIVMQPYPPISPRVSRPIWDTLIDCIRNREKCTYLDAMTLAVILRSTAMTKARFISGPRRPMVDDEEVAADIAMSDYNAVNSMAEAVTHAR